MACWGLLDVVICSCYGFTSVGCTYTSVSSALSPDLLCYYTLGSSVVLAENMLA